MKTIIGILIKTVLITLTLIASSCGSSKIEELLKEGYVAQKGFKTTVPFEMRQGFIVLKIQIEDKTYDFLLDTGASNVITTEVMNYHNLKPLDSELVYDVHHEGKKLDYMAIDAIKIGDVSFSETITTVFDFNQIEELKALNVQGIIGANLMRKAIWDIDFPNKNITITDTEDLLDIPENYDMAKFFIGYTGTPSITSKVNGMRVLNNKVDTGYNGSIKLSKIEFMKLRKKGKIDQYVTSEGASVGIYGAGTNQTSYSGLVNEINYGNLKVNPSVVSFMGVHNKLIGMEFLKNYRVIFNWNTRKMKFIEATPYKNDKLFTYGFSVGLDNAKIIIRSITKKSEADHSGMQLGDHIVAINNKNCDKVTLQQWNEIVKNDFSNPKKNTMKVTIKRGDKLQDVSIDRTILLKHNNSKS